LKANKKPPVFLPEGNTNKNRLFYKIKITIADESNLACKKYTKTDNFHVDFLENFSG